MGAVSFTGVKWRPSCREWVCTSLPAPNLSSTIGGLQLVANTAVERTKEEQQEPDYGPQLLLSLRPRALILTILEWTLTVEVKLPSRIRSLNEQRKYPKNETQRTSAEISVASRFPYSTWISNESCGSQRCMPESRCKY